MVPAPATPEDGGIGGSDLITSAATPAAAAAAVEIDGGGLHTATSAKEPFDEDLVPSRPSYNEACCSFVTSISRNLTTVSVDQVKFAHKSVCEGRIIPTVDHDGP